MHAPVFPPYAHPSPSAPRIDAHAVHLQRRDAPSGAGGRSWSRAARDEQSILSPSVPLRSCGESSASLSGTSNDRRPFWTGLVREMWPRPVRNPALESPCSISASTPPGRPVEVRMEVPVDHSVTAGSSCRDAVRRYGITPRAQPRALKHRRPRAGGSPLILRP